MRLKNMKDTSVDIRLELAPAENLDFCQRLVAKRLKTPLNTPTRIDFEQAAWAWHASLPDFKRKKP